MSKIDKKIKTSQADVLWSYMGTFFSLASGFLLLPFILRYLNSNALGLWYVFLSINGLLALFDFGFAPTFARNFAYVWGGAEKLTKQGVTAAVGTSVNKHLFRMLYSSCRLLYLIMSLIAVTLLSTVGTLYIYKVTNGFVGSYFLLSWIIIVISFFMNLYVDYFASILRGIGEIRAVNIALVISKGAQIIVSAILLIFGFGILGAVIGFLIQGIIFRQYCRHVFIKKKEIKIILDEKEHRFKIKELLKTIKIILPNSMKDGFVSIANYTSTQGSSLIISMQLSLVVVGHYSLVLQLLNAVASISIAINNAYLPLIQIKMVNKRKQDLQRIIGRCQTAYIFVFLAGILGVFFVVMPLVSYIRPGFTFSTLTFVLMAVYYFLFNQQSGYAMYIAAANELPYVTGFIISAVLSVLMTTSVLMFTNFGLTGMVCVQIIIQAVFNNWYWPRYFYKREKLDMNQTMRIGFEEWLFALKKTFKNRSNH
ncbi:O-unit flippase-like protein [Pediococcus ethanolidurans]|uniref:O-unit flippase-like protein n=1 Tax=Pediococcus ethanolidurans TaxID=319653 RepID=UPI001C1ECE18|nr:oligosaccharide flippase family protein [Pediococcus ethanolidurans]